MKSKILAGVIALSIMLAPTVVSHASDNISDITSEKNTYLECADCTNDNGIEITLCEKHASELQGDIKVRCGGDIGLATGPNGNTIPSPTRAWYDAPLYPNLDNYYLITRNKVGTNKHSMVGIWNNRSSSNYVSTWIEDGSGNNITYGSWYDLPARSQFYYQIDTPGAYYNQSVRLGMESYVSMSYTGYCDGVVDYH